MNTLINLIGAYYNQDVWCDYDTHEEVWQSYMSDNPHKINALLADIKNILATDEGDIHQFIKDHSDGLSFESPEESKSFLEDVYYYIKMNI